MKTALLFLGTLAVILGIFAYFAVFGSPTGSYAISAPSNASDAATATLILTAPTSTVASSTTLGNVASSSLMSTFGTSFTTPPLSWPEGSSTIAINAVALQGTQMTFTLTVQTGAAPVCIPLNVRLIADEEGDLDPPNPASFAFPDSGNCNGTPNQTYTGQTATFTVDPTAFPLLFTTGGISNIYFEVTTSSDNGLNVVFPGTSG